MTDRTAAPAADGSDWRSRAACGDVDLNIFFPASDGGSDVARAKAVCAGCPVCGRCLDEALRRIPEGIAGGLTAAERRTLVRGQQQRADPNELVRTARTRTETAKAGRLLLAAGCSRASVARVCGVSERTVYRWLSTIKGSANATEAAS